MALNLATNAMKNPGAWEWEKWSEDQQIVKGVDATLI
jgi:hypothetical protein